MTDQQADFIIIGAGIAGASVAYFLAQGARVVVLEQESQPGYHSSGRSAAMFMASYGPPQVRALSCASRAFFDGPPPGFCEHELLTARGAMLFAAPGQQAQLDEHERLARSVPGAVERFDAARALQRVPVLRPEHVLGAVLEHDALDIDVNALLQGFLRGARAHGGTLVCGATVAGLRRAGGQWQAVTPQGTFRAPVLVNAAGAWADMVGQMAGAAPLGLVPKRRSALLFEAPPGAEIARWPMFMDADQSFYIKPDAGLLLASPVNADPVAPHDVQAEELDIAIAIDAIERLTTMRVRRPRHVWAGLRSFVPDGELVGGFDPVAPGLFWAAAQGGYGIQTAPAAGQLYAGLLLGAPQSAASALHGVDPAALSPHRLAR